jgi:glycerophosphoryl diester phosphodiesterase
VSTHSKPFGACSALTSSASADVWTVNKRAEMIEATKWGAKAILTDRTAEFLKLREQMNGERRSVVSLCDARH